MFQVSNKLVDHLVIGVAGVKDLETQIPAHLDTQAMSAALEQVLATGFTGSVNECFTAVVKKGEEGYLFVTFFGVKGHKGEASHFRDLGEAVVVHLKSFKPKKVSFYFVDKITTHLDEESQIENFLSGFVRNVWEPTIYPVPSMDLPEELNFLNVSTKTLERIREVTIPSLYGMFFAYKMADAPPNKLTPKDLECICQKELTPLGLTIKSLGHAELAKLGLNLVNAVGKGSKNREKIITIEWKPKDRKGTKPIALVGKGVTFDSGGLCLKGRHSMLHMKLDMVGAAIAAGVMCSVARQQLPVHVVAVLVCAENSVSQRAYRPADVITSYTGKSVEVFNTDAEGRLMLADTLAYTAKEYKPSCMFSIATLTGAAKMLTDFYAVPFFTDNEEMYQDLVDISDQCGETVWRFPFAPVEDLYSDVADMKNTGAGIFSSVMHAYTSVTTSAGSGLAAQFLRQFVPSQVPWVHMDVYGTTFKPRANELGLYSYTYTGRGIRLLLSYIMKKYSLLK